MGWSNGPACMRDLIDVYINGTLVEDKMRTF
jgi:hypothetical protein